MVEQSAMVPLPQWCRETATNEATARYWASTGQLDGGVNAAQLGRAGWKAARKGGRWFLVYVAPEPVTPAPSTDEAAMRRIAREELALVLRPLVERLEAGLQREGVFDQFDPTVSAFAGRRGAR